MFSDYDNPPATSNSSGDPVQIIDPVNPENNVSRLYTRSDANAIVAAALDAGNAIDYALEAQTKQETVRSWQRVDSDTSIPFYAAIVDGYPRHFNMIACLVLGSIRLDTIH